MRQIIGFPQPDTDEPVEFASKHKHSIYSFIFRPLNSFLYCDFLKVDFKAILQTKKNM